MGLRALRRTIIAAEAFMLQEATQLRIPTVSRYALSSCVTAALLAGCGGSQSTIGASGAMPQRLGSTLAPQAPASSGYESLYSFTGQPDGNTPEAGLVALNGVLYGTTWKGGAGFPTGGGLGAFFSVTTTGAERVLYSFTDQNNGDNPSSNLIAVNGLLYGVASGEPPDNTGVVYSVTISGGESVVHTFKYVFRNKRSVDGSNPDSALTALDGKLYGTTGSGGTGLCRGRKHKVGCGVVFEVTASGAERVVYNFRGGRHGKYPVGNLVAANGTLYGTTASGGDRSACSGYGCGTVFSVSTSGVEHELYRFKGPASDGEPTGSSNGLVAFNNVLYGTTTDGGTSGRGTVYAITLSGKETILHSFTGGPDGAYPSARLKVVKGALYGTTYAGGTSTNCSGGCGAVFKISTSGTEQVLYSFQGNPDGTGPVSDLTLLNGGLYGTTSTGGSEGAGTVFRISP